ncbi:hypothetical protein [Thermovibrio sp.]
MEKVSLLITGEPVLDEEFLSSLESNREFIGEVIFAGKVKEVDASFPVRSLNLTELKGGEVRNALVKESSYENILFLESKTILEEELIEELLEEKSESRADVVFPNLILREGDNEKVKNYTQVLGREVELLPSLSIEDYLPETSLLTSKGVVERGGGFNDFLEDYELYEFIYRNIRNLKLSLSELSYATYEPLTSFIDTAYRAFVLRSVVLRKFDWQKELFPFLSWRENEKVAKATALTLIGKKLASYYDYFNAQNYLRGALLSFHNRETLRELIGCFLNMGLFDSAREFASASQGLTGEEVERERERISKIEQLIKELEEAVKEGKLREVMVASAQVLEVYGGAPLYNLLGVVNWIMKNTESAFKFFYKATTMNPLNEDYLYNLTEVAKELSLSFKVDKLLKVLLEDNFEGSRTSSD